MKVFFGFVILALTALIPAVVDYLDIVNGPPHSDGTGVVFSTIGLIIVGIMSSVYLIERGKY